MPALHTLVAFAVVAAVFVAVPGQSNLYVLARRPRLRVGQHRATGVLYLGLGGWAAASGAN